MIYYFPKPKIPLTTLTGSQKKIFEFGWTKDAIDGGIDKKAFAASIK
jgi:hypothetical protein